jgi:LysR family carnitine catabolism transcriptional activator
MNINQKQLRIFVTTAQSGNITRASKKLGISQPALTRGLAAFESSLNVSLFSRTTRRLALTPAGERFLPLAQRLLQDMADATEALVNGNNTATGRVTLTMGSTVGATLMPTLLKAFMSSHPGIRVDVVESYGMGTTQAVLSGEVDLGIGTPLGEISGLSCHLLLQAPLGVVYRPDKYKLIDGSLDTLSDLPILKEIANSSIIDLLRHRGSPIVSMMSKDINVTSLTMQLALVEAGMGVAIMSALAASHPQVRNLGFMPLEPEILRPIFLLRRSNSMPNPAAEALATVITQHLSVQNLRHEIRLV